MQNQGSPLSKKPLFAQGAMYPSPPASPFHSPGAGQQQQYAPNFSPHGGDRSGPPSPFPSPRFSTPVHSYQPPPRYPRESYGSPRSPWQHTGQHGYTPRQRFNSSRRSSGGSRGSSWSASPYSSPRAAAGGSFMKPSMVEDPWAELKDMARVKPPASAATDTPPAADSDHDDPPSDSAEPATEDS
ncbi:uncharacterized protein LOC144169766 [Haemaphysalis longicornis]